MIWKIFGLRDKVGNGEYFVNATQYILMFLNIFPHGGMLKYSSVSNGMLNHVCVSMFV